MSKLYVSNRDETVRIFKSDLLEFFSHVHFTTPLILFIPVVMYFLYRGVFHFELPILHVAAWFVAGLATWTFSEYVLHRFVFHFNPRGKLLERVHFICHGVHHDYPSDSKRLVMPPVLSIPLAAGFYFLFRWLLGESTAAPHFAGFITGYLIYDLTHYAIHHFNMHSPMWLAIKNHHMRHHFMDPHKGYGVSSPLWDYIFHTQFVSRNKKETLAYRQVESTVKSS